MAVTRRLLSLALAFVAFAAPAFGHSLPLGDGKVTTSGPRTGYIYSCQGSFNGRGANGPTPWITGDTWDPHSKPTVDGNVEWPDAEISITTEGALRVVRANSLPDHATGSFPIARDDDAYRYDRNPNSIREQTVLLRLPVEPQIAQKPTCLGMGMIGFALTGTAIYNGIDAVGRDAPAHEVQDKCNGHPQERGQYHYHNASPCMGDTRSEAGGHSDLVGYAMDGFGIFGLYGEGDRKVTNDDLDACHGHTHEVTWNGKKQAIYHYHLTDEYPYTLGCFTGTPVRQPMARRDARGDGPRGEGRPPRGRFGQPLDYDGPWPPPRR